MMKQYELARKHGVTGSMISYLVLGKRYLDSKLKNIPIAIDLSKLTGKPFTDFFRQESVEWAKEVIRNING